MTSQPCRVVKHNMYVHVGCSVPCESQAKINHFQGAITKPSYLKHRQEHEYFNHHPLV